MCINCEYRRSKEGDLVMKSATCQIQFRMADGSIHTSLPPRMDDTELNALRANLRRIRDEVEWEYQMRQLAKSPGVLNPPLYPPGTPITKVGRTGGNGHTKVDLKELED